MQKKLLGVILIASIILAMPACKKMNSNKIIEFNNQFADDQHLVLQHEAQLYMAIYENKPTDSLRMLLSVYQEVLDSMVNKYQKPFKLEDTFRKGALELFGVYNDIAKNTYPYLISLLDSANENAAFESAKIIDVMMRIDSIEDTINKKILSLQRYIIEKYDIN
jgi:hypothetical protein